MRPSFPVTLVECPRDALQGLDFAVPTSLKVSYLQTLLEVGFHTLDFGSFVSPKAAPQMADTAEVLEALDLSRTNTRLLAIVANLRGALQACSSAKVSSVGYPFSVSETFQQRNIHRNMADSLTLIGEIADACRLAGKELVAYLSMAFGNPYGDAWSESWVVEWAGKIAESGVSVIALADTTGVGRPDSIRSLMKKVIEAWPSLQIGGHFHARPDQQTTSLEAAWEGGCRRFDAALGGFGGCPFAQDTLVGNLSTEALLAFLDAKSALPALNMEAWSRAIDISQQIFKAK